MAVITNEYEVVTAIPPAKMFKAFVLDAAKVIPKAVPQAVKSIELVEGDGGVGSIKRINFGDGAKFEYVKNKVEAIDKENFTYSYSIIEGDVLLDKVEKITFEIKIVASPEGGSVCKSVSKYYPKGDFVVSEDQIKAGREKALGLFRAIEAYILANPDAC